MYKVEYLVLFDVNKTQCKSVAALKSLLQADSDISIDRNKINYKKSIAELTIKLGKNDDKAHIYFNLSLKCKSEEDLQSFSGILKSVRKSLSLISKTTYVVWDDLSLYYASQAYPLLFNIENLMRLLISKFMLTNLGLGWTKERVPTDVQQSINSGNNDSNYLNNVDFIQLKNFLFSENYPSHKDSLIKELKKAKDFTNLNIDEIKSLLPESNWERFFEPFVGCEADYLKKRWDKLYELRCKVAHNKDFNKSSLEEVQRLTSELKPILEKAISSLDEIAVSEEEKDTAFENVLSNYHHDLGRFMSRYHRLEMVLDMMVSTMFPDSRIANRKGITNHQAILLENGVISERQYIIIKMAKMVRNRLVHNEFEIDPHEVFKCQMEVEQLVIELEDFMKMNGIVK